MSFSHYTDNGGVVFSAAERDESGRVKSVNVSFINLVVTDESVVEFTHRILESATKKYCGDGHKAFYPDPSAMKCVDFYQEMLSLQELKSNEIRAEREKKTNDTE